MRTSVLLLALLLTTPALHAQDGLDQVRPLLAHGRYVEAARELQRIALEGEASQKLDPADEKILRGAIGERSTPWPFITC